MKYRFTYFKLIMSFLIFALGLGLGSFFAMNENLIVKAEVSVTKCPKIYVGNSLTLDSTYLGSEVDLALLNSNNGDSGKVTLTGNDEIGYTLLLDNVTINTYRKTGFYACIQNFSTASSQNNFKNLIIELKENSVNNLGMSAFKTDSYCRYGIFSKGDIVIKGNATLNVAGYLYGIFTDHSDITIQETKINAYANANSAILSSGYLGYYSSNNIKYSQPADIVIEQGAKVNAVSYHNESPVIRCDSKDIVIQGEGTQVATYGGTEGLSVAGIGYIDSEFLAYDEGSIIIKDKAKFTNGGTYFNETIFDLAQKAISIEDGYGSVTCDNAEINIKMQLCKKASYGIFHNKGTNKTGVIIKNNSIVNISITKESESFSTYGIYVKNGSITVGDKTLESDESKLTIENVTYCLSTDFQNQISSSGNVFFNNQTKTTLKGENGIYLWSYGNVVFDNKYADVEINVSKYGISCVRNTLNMENGKLAINAQEQALSVNEIPDLYCGALFVGNSIDDERIVSTQEYIDGTQEYTYIFIPVSWIIFSADESINGSTITGGYGTTEDNPIIIQSKGGELDKLTLNEETGYLIKVMLKLTNFTSNAVLKYAIKEINGYSNYQDLDYDINGNASLQLDVTKQLVDTLFKITYYSHGETGDSLPIDFYIKFTPADFDIENFSFYKTEEVWKYWSSSNTWRDITEKGIEITPIENLNYLSQTVNNFEYSIIAKKGQLTTSDETTYLAGWNFLDLGENCLIKYSDTLTNVSEDWSQAPTLEDSKFCIDLFGQYVNKSIYLFYDYDILSADYAPVVYTFKVTPHYASMVGELSWNDIEWHTPIASLKVGNEIYSYSYFDYIIEVANTCGSDALLTLLENIDAINVSNVDMSGNTLTIDMNGKTLNYGKDYYLSLTATGLIIYDSSEMKTGLITSVNEKRATIELSNSTYSNLEYYGGTVSGVYAAIYHFGKGYCGIYDGEIISQNENSGALVVAHDATFEITGGTIYGTKCALNLNSVVSAEISGCILYTTGDSSKDKEIGPVKLVGNCQVVTFDSEFKIGDEKCLPYYGIYSSSYGTIRIMGGQVFAAKYGIYNTYRASIYLSGFPTFNCPDSGCEIYSTVNGKIFARDSEDSTHYYEYEEQFIDIDINIDKPDYTIVYDIPYSYFSTIFRWINSDNFIESRFKSLSNSLVTIYKRYALIYRDCGETDYIAFSGNTDVYETNQYICKSNFQLPTGKKDGYQFVGWYDNFSGTGSRYLSIPSSMYGDKVFYAKWKKLSYIVNYSSGQGYTITATKNGENFVSGKAVDIDEEIEFSIVAHEGYVNPRLIVSGDKRDFNNNILTNVCQNISVTGAANFVKIKGDNAVKGQDYYIEMTTAKGFETNISLEMSLFNATSVNAVKKVVKQQFEGKQEIKEIFNITLLRGKNDIRSNDELYNGENIFIVSIDLPKEYQNRDDIKIVKIYNTGRVSEEDFSSMYINNGTTITFKTTQFSSIAFFALLGTPSATPVWLILLIVFVVILLVMFLAYILMYELLYKKGKLQNKFGDFLYKWIDDLAYRIKNRTKTTTKKKKGKGKNKTETKNDNEIIIEEKPKPRKRRRKNKFHALSSIVPTEKTIKKPQQNSVSKKKENDIQVVDLGNLFNNKLNNNTPKNQQRDLTIEKEKQKEVKEDQNQEININKELFNLKQQNSDVKISENKIIEVNKNEENNIDISIKNEENNKNDNTSILENNNINNKLNENATVNIEDKKEIKDTNSSNKAASFETKSVKSKNTQKIISNKNTSKTSNSRNKNKQPYKRHRKH